MMVRMENKEMDYKMGFLLKSVQDERFSNI